MGFNPPGEKYGLALVATGILYFVIAGQLVLPRNPKESGSTAFDPMKYFQDVYGVRYELSEVVVTDGSGLIGKQFDDVESVDHVRVIATKLPGEAIGAGANPAVSALTVAIATSNSFLIPTHQVNALIMGPAGYRVADFLRAGGIMTILFLLVMTVVMGLLY